MGIFLGLAAALGWGVSDFWVRDITRTIGSFRALIFLQGVGLLFITALVLLSGQLAGAFVGIRPSDWVLAIAEAFVGLLGSFCLYRAFATGTLAIVSPIVSSYSAITVVLAVLAGETLTALALAGVLAALLGIVLTSIDIRQAALQPEAAAATAAVQPSARRIALPPGVPWALGAALLYGLTFWMLGDLLVPRFGPLLPIAINRGVALLTLAALAVLGRIPVRMESRFRNRLILISIIDTLAFSATTLGTTTEAISIVTVLSSLFSPVTVLLAWVFLRERPQPVQWLGIVLIFAAIVLVSI